MSQPATAQRPDKTGEIQQWTVTIEPVQRDRSDAVLGEVVAPLAAQALSWGAQRWFYTRCPDAGRSLIQLRVRARTDIIERLQSLMQALVDQAVPHLGEMQINTDIEEPAPPSGSKEVLSPRIEAGHARYGGAEGVALAEEVFELSSGLAVWATARFPKRSERSSLAALLLFDAADAMMHGQRSSVWADRRRSSWQYYWDSHLRSCSAAWGNQAAQMRAMLISRSAPRVLPVHRMMATLASEPAVDNWRRRWSKAIDIYLYRADKARASRPAQHLTVYQSRLMLNRLDISVRDEAGLGLYARSWSKEREEAFLGRGL